MQTRVLAGLLAMVSASALAGCPAFLSDDFVIARDASADAAPSGLPDGGFEGGPGQTLTRLAPMGRRTTRARPTLLKRGTRRRRVFRRAHQYRRERFEHRAQLDGLDGNAGVTGYNIFRSGTQVGTLPSASLGQRPHCHTSTATR